MLAAILYILGALGVIGSVLMFFSDAGILGFGLGESALVSSLLVMAAGRVIDTLSVIEKHTRATAQIMRRLLPPKDEPPL